jgi:uncharacterized protein (PEP-CTERM system associated)
MGRWNGSGPAVDAVFRGGRAEEGAARPRRGAFSTAGVLAGVAAALASTGASAEKWTVDAGISSQFEATSNANLGEAGARSDAILGIRPHIGLIGEGAQFRISGSAALNGLAYLRDTQPNRLQPEADLQASLQAVPRLFYIDAGLRAYQTRANLYGAQQEAGSTNENSVTTVSARLSPRIEGRYGDHLRYLVRSDNSWTREGGSTAPVLGSNASGYFGQNTASIERDPLPLGWRLEAQRSETTYRDLAQKPLVIALARATTLYAPFPDLSLGVHGGYEHNSFDTPDSGPWFYGLDGKWLPTPRTVVSAFAEKRFFGGAWRLAFDHRTPAFAWNIVSSRTLQTAPQSVFDLPATNNVTALLDSIFTTRYPDPVERARAVQTFIASQGLPTSTSQASALQQQQLSVVQLNTATVTLIGTRNTVTVSAFQSRTSDAPVADIGLPFGNELTNNKQVGASLALSHKLTPTYTLTASADWSRVASAPGFGDERTSQKTARLWLNVLATQKASAFVGTRYTRLDSNTAVSGHATAVYAGVDYRF